MKKSVVDPDPYVLGPPDPHPDPLVTITDPTPDPDPSIHHLLFCDFMTFYQCSGSASGPYVFGPPGSASGSVRQRYGSEDPDSRIRIRTNMSRIHNTDEK
jgi:hypothetical protein